MCGIAGYISAGPLSLQPLLSAMAASLAHRGPDGERFYIHEQGKWGLAHRRLSIIDPSPASAQPLHYQGTVLVFNGEIYNYLELRTDLQQKGYSFRSEGDSEVIPALFLEYGTASFAMLDGMFAFGLYHPESGEFYLVRDRLGEKPLYYHAHYGERGRFSRFAFGSEMKALWAAGVPRHLRAGAMLNYLGAGLVQNPLNKTDTFFSDVLTLPPGHFLRINPAECRLQMRRWYRPETLWQQPAFTGTEEEGIQELRDQLMQSVQRRLRSDVALGASISGGVDSSAIASAILRQHPELMGFSAVFPGFEKDESAFVDQLSAHFGSALQIRKITPEPEMLALEFDQLMYHQEEPLQSASVYTQFCIYRQARRDGVKVMLDGQGADEVLGGYKRYMVYHLMDLFGRDPGQVWNERTALMRHGLLTEGLWNLMQTLMAGRYPKRAAIALQNRAFRQLLRTPHLNPDFLYRHRNYDSLQKPVIHSLNDLLHHQTFYSGLQELLRYADRNSMAHGTEVRLPFLAPELVNWLFTIREGKVKRGWNKWMLRRAISPWLPESIAWRQGKTGYEPPQALWMKHPLMLAKVNEARKKLVEAGVLMPSVLSSAITGQEAHAGDNYAWRQLCAAALL